MSPSTEDQQLHAAGRVSGLIAACATPGGYLLGVAIWVAGSMAGLAPMSGEAPYLGSLMFATGACWAVGLLVGLMASAVAMGTAAGAKSGGSTAAALGVVGFASTAGGVLVMLLTVAGLFFWVMSHSSGVLF